MIMGESLKAGRTKFIFTTLSVLFILSETYTYFMDSELVEFLSIIYLFSPSDSLHINAPKKFITEHLLLPPSHNRVNLRLVLEIN